MPNTADALLAPPAPQPPLPTTENGGLDGPDAAPDNLLLEDPVDAADAPAEPQPAGGPKTRNLARQGLIDERQLISQLTATARDTTQEG